MAVVCSARRIKKIQEVFVMPNIVVAANAAEPQIISITDSLIYSAIGFAIVFAVLLILMAFIAIMSKVLSLGKKPEKAVAAAPVAPRPAPAVKKAPAAGKSVPEGAMQVTLGGKKHTVTVTEKMPRFTVTLNGKSHAVDVEEVEKEAAE